VARSLRRLALCLALTRPLAACTDDGSGPEPTDQLFRRYVALGNSITAGVQSEGINDSTQLQAYPVLLARRAGAEFETILLRQPGCPPPLVGPILLTAERIGGGSADTCSGFVTSASGAVQNLAVPGLQIADVLELPEGPFAAVYRDLFCERTLVDLMVDADPSLVSVWLGNNDALRPAVAGDPATLTTLSHFRASLDAITSAIADRTAARDAILIGVIDPPRPAHGCPSR
jgi:hypothetical protein